MGLSDPCTYGSKNPGATWLIMAWFAASAGGVFILLRVENRLESRRDGRVMLQNLVRYRL